jgi:hypothetical protein
LEVTDINGDGKNEVVITRTGRKNSPNAVLYFYNGWYVQVEQIDTERQFRQSTNLFLLIYHLLDTKQQIAGYNGYIFKILISMQKLIFTVLKYFNRRL